MVVGSGASLRGIHISLPSWVASIAVNGGIEIYPEADYFFTLDASADPRHPNQQRMARRRRKTIYYAALPEDIPLPRHVRRLRRVTGSMHGRLRCRGGIPDLHSEINTGNSGWGALQLAVHLGARRIALLGIDGHGPYALGGEPRGLLWTMPELFASAVPDLRDRGVEVICGSPDSTVTCFPRCGPREALLWAMESAE